MRMVIACLVNILMICLCLIGLSLVIHGYSSLAPNELVPNFNEELNEGGWWMMLGFGIMAIGIVRLLAHIESLFVAIFIGLAYLFQAIYS